MLANLVLTLTVSPVSEAAGDYGHVRPQVHRRVVYAPKGRTSSGAMAAITNAFNLAHAGLYQNCKRPRAR